MPNPYRSEEHTSELQSHSDLPSFPTRRSSDLDHPLGPVLRRDERVHDLEPLDRPLLLLALRGADRLAERRRLGGEVEVAQEVADRLRAHAAPEVDAEPVQIGRAHV